MKEFRKKDLRTGDILVTKEEGNAILIGNRVKKFEHLENNFGLMKIDDYNDELESIPYREYDIEKVYRIIDGYAYSLEELIEELPEDKVELVWKRERKIDWWNKVPMWTRVLVRNDNKEDWTKAYFLYESNNDDYPYCVTICDRFTYNEVFDKCYSQIKPFDENDIKEEWYFKEDGENANE